MGGRACGAGAGEAGLPACRRKRLTLHVRKIQEEGEGARGKGNRPCPSPMLLGAFGPGARALLDASHIGPIGPDSIVLEPECLEGLHGKEGRPALRQPSGEQHGPPSGAVRMSAGSTPEGP
jgi:hypothetical protein